MIPRVWHLAVIAVAFASLAATSCAEFLRYGPYPAGEPAARLFVISAVLAGGPLVLAVFRYWRRESWPALATSGRIAAAAFALAAIGYVGVLSMAFVVVSLRWRVIPVAMTFVVIAVAGFIVMVGALELLAISAFTEMAGRKTTS
jgi:hypothetical protein